jgi:hypothetical protein
MAQEKIYNRENSKIAELKDLLAEERADQDITVEHILWQCPNYDTKSGRSNISRETLGNNKEEMNMVIKYLKEIGLVHYI